MTSTNTPSRTTQLTNFLRPSAKQPEWVTLPECNFLMIDGQGNPNTSLAYREALEALYPLAYTLKFGIKKAEGLDWKVAPLEGLWWADDMKDFTTGAKTGWKWTMMIQQPDAVTPTWFDWAVSEVRRKTGPSAPVEYPTHDASCGQKRQRQDGGS
jgi:hypothetical protein